MDRRNSLNGRLSLSTSNLSSPIAESTHIGSLQQKFPWGGIHSPVKTIENSSNYSRNINESGKRNSTLQKLDPRVYTDVQSQGLTSRIVKYYENSMKLNRSVSFNNLYNKPGQFPVVHLKKNEIPYKFSRNKNNVSIVRIAPPDKSVFQANSRSSILRSGSVVPTVSLGLKTANNDVARENRPILHPALENEITPTRSVLEALKEISRKRINSDELDSNDSIKKYCKDSNYESSSNLTAPMASMTTHQNTTNSNNSTYVKSTAKRYRELTSPSISPTAKIPNRQNIDLSVKPRRLHNEFTSSISSSLSLLTPKRKYSEQNMSSRNSSFESGEISPSNDQPRQKQRCEIVYNIVDKPVNNIESTKRSSTAKSTLSAVAVSNLYIPSKIVKPIRTSSEPVIKTSSNLLESVNQKPKLTLFNKNYELSEKVSTSKKTLPQTEDDNEIPKIPFVKPKNQTNNGIRFTKNAMIEKTQQNKLALMLSGLRGDLDEDQDEIDNSIQVRNLQSSDEIKENVVIAAKSNCINRSTDLNLGKIGTKKLEESQFKSISSNTDTKEKKKSENTKEAGGFRFPLEENKPTNAISFDLKKEPNNSTQTTSFTFGNNKNEIITLPQISQSSSVLTFNSTGNSTSTINFNNSNNITSKSIPVETASKANVKDNSDSAKEFVISSNINFPNSGETVKSDNLPLTEINQKSSNLINVQTTTTQSMQNISNNQIQIDGPTNNPKMLFGPNSSENKTGQTMSNTITHNNLVFGSTDGFTNEKVQINAAGHFENQNQPSNIPKPGGFAFGNNLNNVENNSNLFQFSKNNGIQIPNATTNLVPENIKTGNLFSEINRSPTSNTNNLIASSFKQQSTGFNFGNNQSNENSNTFTTSQQSGQTNSTFSFTSPTNKSTTANFAFGNINPNENVNKMTFSSAIKSTINSNSNEQDGNVASSQTQISFTSNDSVKTVNSFNSNTIQPTAAINNQNNSFQFTNTSNPTHQHTIDFKSSDSSKDKSNSVFGSNSGPNNSNNTFLFGSKPSPSQTKNVFVNGSANITNNQLAQENKTGSIFGASNNKSLLKSPTTFSLNSNVTPATNANSNSTTSTGAFSFSSSNHNNNPQLNAPKNSAATFTFGGNNNSSNSFGNNKSDTKSNTFGSASSVPNVFGGNISSNASNSFGTIKSNTSNNSGNNITNSFNSNGNNTNSFNVNNQNNTNTFMNNNPINNTGGKFAFGQSAGNVNTNSNNKNAGAFVFASSNTMSNNSTNNLFNFGNNNASSASTVDSKPVAFNFGNVGCNNNIFAVNANNNTNASNISNHGTSGPNDRPIRKATRRLNK